MKQTVEPTLAFGLQLKLYGKNGICFNIIGVFNAL